MCPESFNTKKTNKKMSNNEEKPQKITIAFDQHLAKCEAIFITAYDQVRTALASSHNDATNIVVFVIKAMQAVADTDIHGWEKKSIVVDIVYKVVDDLNIEESQKSQIRHTVLPTVDSLIDLLVSAAKGYLYLKHQSREALDAVSTRCSCLPRRRRQRHHRPLRIADEALDMTGMVDDVYDVVKTIVKNRNVTMANIMSIGSVIMQVVEQYPQLVGYQKKQLVICVAHKVVDELSIDDATKVTIKAVIDSTLDKAIEFIIKASRGEIEIVNKIVEATTGCIDRCAKGGCCGRSA